MSLSSTGESSEGAGIVVAHNLGNVFVVIIYVHGVNKLFESRNLRGWLQEQFGNRPLEQCEDMSLHNAAHVGDLDTLKTLLQEESFKQCSSKEDPKEELIWSCGLLPCTPLRIAAMMGHSECVDYMISQGAAVDLVDVKGQTALYMAVVNGHLDCVKILLKADADPNGSIHHRSTPVYHAAQVGRVDILLELIRIHTGSKLIYRLDQRFMFGTRTLTTLAACSLFISAAYHHLPCFRILLNASANPNYKYNGPVSREAQVRGRASCMLDAVLKLGCEPAFVSLLLDHGADPYLVPWDELDPDTMVHLKVNAEAFRIYQEAKRNPRRLMNLCCITIRKIMSKKCLACISSLPLPETVINFMFHKD
ncbi:ankyrin repeat and SOCS box protein 1-like [Sinocyclocheilus rhinocerous]|uniref:ankyrin repeat and SOCS box protein 1-like n=1 Tax=Sinocyclocheilus rhinocerous TaxID=307959 RepID=UPI0007B82849|nr:PREDICTED: ankyrin repeat and SOCS box protein 1-like [Sinocyclocheilus rhinocerous]